MDNLVQKAIYSFREGQNCAQSVLSTYAERFELDAELALSFSSGFGAGMGRLQETCGAVTGAFMVIGLYNRTIHSDNSSLKEASMLMIQEYERNFKLKNNSTNCKALINCDLSTEAGQSYFKENNIAETVCEKCIADSIHILNKIIEA